MLVRPELEKLLPKVDNRYTLSVLIAKRVRQLVDGAQQLQQSDSPNLVTIACEELAHDKVACIRGQLRPYIPLKPEIEAARIAARAAEEQANMADAVKEALDQAAGIESERTRQSDEVHLISENLITISEELAEVPAFTDQTDEQDYDDADENSAEQDKTIIDLEMPDDDQADSADSEEDDSANVEDDKAIPAEQSDEDGDKQ